MSNFSFVAKTDKAVSEVKLETDDKAPPMNGEKFTEKNPQEISRENKSADLKQEVLISIHNSVKKEETVLELEEETTEDKVDHVIEESLPEVDPALMTFQVQMKKQNLIKK